jgi:biopolymer transport protein ExbB
LRSLFTLLILLGVLFAAGPVARLLAQVPPTSSEATPAAATPAATSSPAATTTGKAAPNESPGFMAIVFSGGIVGIIIMLAIIGLSITAAALTIEHAMTIRENVLVPAGLAERVRDQLLGGNLVAADQICQTKPSLLSFVIRAGLAEADGGWSSIEKATEDAIAEQAARLFRKIEFLSVIANIAPMLGLLGTVTGMIMAFREVAESQGAATASDLAEGIYSALVTTVGGLVVAIPCLGVFAVFRNRIDQIVADAAYQVQHVFTPLKRRNTNAPQPRATAVPPTPPPAGGPRK